MPYTSEEVLWDTIHDLLRRVHELEVIVDALRDKEAKGEKEGEVKLMCGG